MRFQITAIGTGGEQMHGHACHRPPRPRRPSQLPQRTGKGVYPAGVPAPRGGQL
jgi:hypothetical protein